MVGLLTHEVAQTYWLTRVGIELFLYFKTIHKLLSRRGAHKKSNLFYAVFSTVMLFSVTVWVVTEVIFGQQTWLPESEYPGGPYAFWKTNLSVWYMEWSRIEIIVLQLMTDALMVTFHARHEMNA